MSKKNIRDHWNLDSISYQKRHKISTEYVHYGPSCPTEDELNLLGDVEGKKIIELGCGGAQCSIALSKKGAICTGVDLSREQLKFARKLAEKNRVKVELIEGDIEHLDMIDDNCFDIAFSAAAFCWTQSLDDVFKEAFRILKENGLLVFSTSHPFFDCLDEEPQAEDLKIKRSYFQKNILFKEHTEITINYVLPTISDIVNSLINNGFVIEKVLEPEPVEEKFGTYTSSSQLEVLKMIPATIIFKARKK